MERIWKGSRTVGTPNHLLEELALIGLQALDFTFPGKSLFEELFVFWFVEGVQGCDVVAFHVRGNSQTWLVVFASADDDTGNLAIVVLTKHDTGSHNVLSRGLQSLKESRNLVGAHENKREFLLKAVQM
jgi:hypothetical protein